MSEDFDRTGEQLCEAAVACGAAKAALLPGEQIVLSASFRDICESNQCGNYGRCWMCPPDVGEIGPLMDAVRSYPRALLYQTIGTLEDSFDIEGMTAAAQAHAQVSRRIQKKAGELLPAGFLHLTCGGCRLCEHCAKRENEPCRHPDEALPSLESFGVDVYNTSKRTGLKYINGQNTVTYFGMVLFGGK